MSTPWTADKLKETVAEIQKRSVTDSEFRTLALKDSSAAVEAVSGVPLPAGAKLRFVNQLDELTVVLPPAGEGELTQEQLEQVSGGTAFIGTIIIVTASVCVDY